MPLQECLKIKTCWACGAPNGVVRKIPGAGCPKISHDVLKSLPSDSKSKFTSRFDSAKAANPDLSDLVGKAKEVLSPIDALRLLRAIPEEDFDLLWLDARFGRPEALIITHVIVPPVCIRPSVAMDAGAFNEDDITARLREIAECNDKLRTAVERGGHVQKLMETWELLHVMVSQVINGDLPGFPATAKSKKASRGICQRMKGKQGRFRCVQCAICLLSASLFGCVGRQGAADV